MRKKISPLSYRLDDIITNIKKQRVFRDPLSVGLIVAALGINVLTLIVVALHVRPSEFLVPVHFNSLDGFDRLGNWYELYSLSVFGFLITFCNALLAMRAFGRSRIASFFVLGGSMVVGALSLIISLAFSAVV